MISKLTDSRDQRWPLVLFGASAVLAVVLGFIVVRPQWVGPLIVRCGYYYICAVFGLWLFYGWRIRSALCERPGVSRKQYLGALLFLVLATLFCVWSDEFGHKVLFDEYVLQGTAWHMHRTKEIGTPIRAYDFAGTWLTVDTFLDKRPYFFPFLVSLLHDLTGFRMANAFALNVALSFVSLTAAFWLVHSITRRLTSAMLAVALLATLPLFGQNATCASMELLNLAMIAIVMVAATLYLSEPTPDRLSFLVLGAVLLAQTRYESVLFVVPVGVVIVIGWLRERRVILSWPAKLAPLLLVPYVWHDRYVSTKPHLWQLREGEATRFGVQYLSGNLEGARHFLFSTSPEQPNSLCLVLLGLAALGWAAIRVWRARRTIFRLWSSIPAPLLVIVLFGAIVVTNLTLLLFYYWSRLDEPVAARFALPLFLWLALLVGWAVHSLELRRIAAVRIAAFALVAWLGVIAAPAYAHRFYTTHNLLMHELEWEVEQVREQPKPVFVITGKATLPYLLQNIPALNTSIARVRGPQIAWHMREGTFREVLVAQVVRPSTAQGDMVVDPEEELPPSFKLEPLAQKRFGARWIRVSRLLEVTPENATTAEIKPLALR